MRGGQPLDHVGWSKPQDITYSKNVDRKLNKSQRCSLVIIRGEVEDGYWIYI